MLNDWILGQHFSFVHFNETRVDFRPGTYTTYVPQLVRMFSEWSVFHLEDEFNAAKEHVVFGKTISNFRVGKRFWRQSLVLCINGTINLIVCKFLRGVGKSNLPTS